MPTNILEVRNIYKSFPGVQALRDVSIDIISGEIHGLVGENGAGKSTLINVLSGVHRCDSGTIYLEQEKYIPKSPLHALHEGINVVHQELKLAETLTVMENIFLGHPPLTRSGLIAWETMKQKAKELIMSIGVELDPEILVSRLSVAQKQIVEICKALSKKAKVVIMDEPSATLTPTDMERLYAIIRKLQKDGITVIYISHRLEEIFKICDRVTVLRDGCKIVSLPTAELDRKKLISLMVGRELGMEYPKTRVKKGDVLFSVRNFNMPNTLYDINFDIHEGEILGFSGLVGAGRTELARAILAADKGAKGELSLMGKRYSGTSVSAAVKKGIGLIPEDRKAQGLVLGMSMKENISIVNLKKAQRFGLLSSKKERSIAKKYIEALKIVPNDESTVVRTLSGGNQQKVVIGKWLNADCSVLIIDEPTRGIDVGAKQEIYKIICELAAEGKAIIMISSDMEEILGMCDRIAVMREGHISGVLDAEEATQEKILDLAII